MAHSLLVTPYGPPEKGAVQVRISETAKRLVKRGYQVTVRPTVPNDPSGIVPIAIGANHEGDFDTIDAATSAIGAGLQPDTLVMYETALPVGTMAQRFARMLASVPNLEVGCDFYPAYSPGCVPEHAGEIRAIILRADYQANQSFDLRGFVRCQVVLEGRKVLCRETIESLGRHYSAIGDGNLREVICQGDEYTFHCVGLQRGGGG